MTDDVLMIDRSDRDHSTTDSGDRLDAVEAMVEAIGTRHLPRPVAIRTPRRVTVRGSVPVRIGRIRRGRDVVETLSGIPTKIDFFMVDALLSIATVDSCA